MSTVIHLRHRRIAPRHSAVGGELLAPSRLADRVAATGAFVRVASSHLLDVAPLVNTELGRWRTRAEAIADPVLRRVALQTLAKRGNIEGAALFAALAPAQHRSAAARALVRFQTAYNYLDGLSELPGDEPSADTRRLHQGLVSAVGPAGRDPASYLHDGLHDDGGYLSAILVSCSEALQQLPSYPTVAPSAAQAAQRIVDFQALNLVESRGGHGELRDWAERLTPAYSGLAWWETAAAAGSSLAVHALIASAATPGLSTREVDDVVAMYFPWLGGLHSLLDSLVDRCEDRDAGLFCFLDYYGSPEQASLRLASLARGGLEAGATLRGGRSHAVIAAAMCSYYLSAPQSATAEGWAVEDALSGIFGLPLRSAIGMFRAKRLLHSLTDSSYS